MGLRSATYHQSNAVGRKDRMTSRYLLSCSVARSAAIGRASSKNIRSSFSGDGAAIGSLFEVSQPRLFLTDVIPSSRNRAELLGKLDLEHHQAAVTEPRLARCQIEFPHSAEPLAEDCSCFGAATKKAPSPCCECVGVMKPQDFDVGHDQPRSFDHGHDLRKRRHVASREYVLRDPRVGGTFAVQSADRVEQRDTVILQVLPEYGEKRIVVAQAHVFEHSDRDDAGERLVQGAIVLETKVDVR